MPSLPVLFVLLFTNCNLVEYISQINHITLQVYSKIFVSIHSAWYHNRYRVSGKLLLFLFTLQSRIDFIFRRIFLGYIFFRTTYSLYGDVFHHVLAIIIDQEKIYKN